MASKNIVLAGVIVAVAIAAVATYALLLMPGQEPVTGPTKRITVNLIEVREGEEGWQPSEIYLTKGDNVEITFVNGDDEFPHGFAIPAFGVKTEELPPRGRTTVTFVADRTGTFEFNDPLSPPECEEEPPEEKLRRDLITSLEEAVKTLEDAANMDQVEGIQHTLESIGRQLAELVEEEAEEAMNGFLGLVEELGEVTSMDQVPMLAEELEEAMEELEEVAITKTTCVPSGQIIIEE